MGLIVSQCVERCIVCGSVKTVAPGKWLSIQCDAKIASQGVSLALPNQLRRGQIANLCEVVLFGSESKKA